MNHEKLEFLKKYSTLKTSDFFIIHGDNALVLPLLIENFKSQVKCIYIDPPYNNGEVYKHYDDNLSFVEWQEKIRISLELLFDFLSDDGSIWISIDDRNVHNLRVIGESVFGIENFVTTIIWQHRTSRENRKNFSNNHEYILVFAKNIKLFNKTRNLLKSEIKQNEYKNPDNDPRGPWKSISVNVQAGHSVPTQFYFIKSPSGKMHYPPKGRCWIYNEEKMIHEIQSGNIWFGKKGDGVPRLKRFISEDSAMVTPNTLWLATEVGTTQDAKREILRFSDENVFDTPKPESLVTRIFEIASNENDLVMDSYLGSGTSAAVAYKLNRRFIGIEINDHIYDFTYKRLKLLSDTDNGIGFSFYKLE